jgi:hypothetical protein
MQNVMLKKLTCKWTLQQVFYLSEAQNPIHPPLHTVYVYTVTLIHTGKGGRVEPEKRFNSLQSWVENTNMTYCISSLQTLINICRKVPFQVNFFQKTTFVLLS